VDDFVLAMSLIGAVATMGGLVLGGIDVHERVTRLRTFVRPAETPKLEEFRRSPEELLSRPSIFGQTDAMSSGRSLDLLNRLRETQERQADELRELSERIAGIAGIGDRPWRLWLSFGLIAGGTALSAAGGIAAAVANAGG
jgi:hypothetical protein